MHPVLINLGFITLPTYGFLFAMGTLAGILISMHLAKKETLDPTIFSDFLFFLLLFSLLGAKLMLLITNLREYLDHPGEIVSLLTSGGTFYGGLLAGVLFALYYIRRHHLRFPVLADLTAPALALGHFFGRLGCFAAGCCYGRYAGDCFLGVTYTDPHILTDVPLFTPLYPTQPIEAVLNLANFFFLYLVYRKRKFVGQVFSLYVLNYSLIRFGLEYFRGDGDRGYIFGSQADPWLSLSIPQGLSLAGIILAIILLRAFRKSSG